LGVAGSGGSRDGPPEDTYTTGQVARVLRIIDRGVRNMIDRGELEASQHDRGRRLIPQRAVHALLEDRRAYGVSPLEGALRPGRRQERRGGPASCGKGWGDPAEATRALRGPPGAHGGTAEQPPPCGRSANAWSSSSRRSRRSAGGCRRSRTPSGARGSGGDHSGGNVSASEEGFEARPTGHGGGGSSGTLCFRSIRGRATPSAFSPDPLPPPGGDERLAEALAPALPGSAISPLPTRSAATPSPLGSGS
jgi:excisionase family DNA binding protein